jgi:hypothetical protein
MIDDVALGIISDVSLATITVVITRLLGECSSGLRLTL